MKRLFPVIVFLIFPLYSLQANAATVYSCIASSADWGTPTWCGEASEAARDSRYSTRQYTTVTSWEAASYGATASDDAIGEVYGTITETSTVTLNDTTPISTLLTSTIAGRHTGSAGTGAEISFTAATGTYGVENSAGVNISWLEFDGNANAIRYLLYNDTIQNTINNSIVHNASGMSSISAGVFLNTAGQVYNIYNNLIYNITGTGADMYGLYASTPDAIVYNNTVTDIENTSATAGDDAYGIRPRDTVNSTFKNNLMSNMQVNGGTAQCFSDATLSTATHAANGVDDTSSSDAGYNSLTITFTGGGDFTPTADSTVLTGGEDLGAGVFDTDLKGRDRDTEGDTWSLGAIQYVSGAPAARRIFMVQ